MKKELFLYLIFGILTTLLSIGVFQICCDLLSLNIHISNLISWILSVSFAFVTNKLFVFDNTNHTGKTIFFQFFSFSFGRVATLIMEELILICFVTLLHFDELLIKILAQFLVIVSNYFISKFLVFKKGN